MKTHLLLLSIVWILILGLAGAAPNVEFKILALDPAKGTYTVRVENKSTSIICVAFSPLENTGYQLTKSGSTSGKSGGIVPEISEKYFKLDPKSEHVLTNNVRVVEGALKSFEATSTKHLVGGRLTLMFTLKGFDFSAKKTFVVTKYVYIPFKKMNNSTKALRKPRAKK